MKTSKKIKNEGDGKKLKITSIPYYFGGYISNPGDFYGRRDELSNIIQKINEAENGRFWHISVVGDYRLGKSSLLRRAQYEITAKTNSIPAYVDLSEVSQNFFTKSIIRKIIGSVYSTFDDNSFGKIKKLLKTKKFDKLKQFDLDFSISGLFKINFNPKEGDHWEKFFGALNSLIQKAKDKKGTKSIVLILDEVNAIEAWSDFRDVLIKMRAFAQQAEGLNLLVGSAYPLYQLTENEWSPFFNIFYQMNLNGLTDEEAVELIEGPAAKVGVYYTKEAIHLIKEICGNKPYYIQVLCTKIFEKLIKKEVVENVIKATQVESATADALDLLNSHFSQILKNCTDYQKEVLIAAATGNNEKTKKLLTENRNQIEFTLLKERGLIYQREKEYTTEELFREWLLRV